MTLPELLAALRAADGPDTTIELAIATWCYENGGIAGVTYDPQTWVIRHGGEFMSSLDAAVMLVPEGRMWWVGHLDPEDLRFVGVVSELGNVGVPSWRGFHAIAATALCIAALSAQEDRG